MKTVAIIQARMGSTRLPGKVLLSLGEISVLGHVITRLQTSKLIDEIWIATSTEDADQIIELEAGIYGAQVYKGSESDVLDRYYQTAVRAQADRVLRITSDCPFIDVDIISQLIDVFERSQCDYASNGLKRTYPRGLDCELFTFETLERTWHKADLDFQREHVTPFIYQHSDQFRIAQLIGNIDYSAHRWTLDTIEDWGFIQAVYEKCQRNNVQPSFKSILDILSQNPEIISINSHIEQKKLGNE